MRHSPTQLDRLLHQVHRRWSMIRTFERIGLSLIVACILAIALSIILISRGQSAQLLVMICLATGLLIGMIIGWLNRPSIFEAAVELDRQFQLADLLATAFSLRKSQAAVSDSFDVKWSGMIVNLAEAKCAALETQSLTLSRIGLRGWSGIGLSMVIALTLGALSGNPLISEAHQPSLNSFSNSFAQNFSMNDQPASASQDPKRRDAESPSNENMNESSVNAQQEEQHATLSDSTGGSSAGADQTGDGAGKTDDGLMKNQPLTGNTESRTNRDGQLAAGGGQSTNHPAAGETSSAMTAGAVRETKSAVAWEAAGWRAAGERADQDLQGGKISDDYRDLVRDYFHR